MTPQQVAKLAGCDVRIVHRAIKAGRIEATKVEDSQPSARTRRPGRTARLVWHVVPKSGKAWVRNYTPRRK